MTTFAINFYALNANGGKQSIGRAVTSPVEMMPWEDFQAGRFVVGQDDGNPSEALASFQYIEESLAKFPKDALLEFHKEEGWNSMNPDSLVYLEAWDADENLT